MKKTYSLIIVLALLTAAVSIFFLIRATKGPPASYVQAEKQKIELLNKREGGVGIKYNFQGPNKSEPKRKITPLD